MAILPRCKDRVYYCAGKERPTCAPPTCSKRLTLMETFSEQQKAQLKKLDKKAKERGTISG